MEIDNTAKDWLLKELTVSQFIEMINYDNELKAKAYKNGIKQNAKTAKSLKDLKELSRRLNS